MFTLDELADARRVVAEVMSVTPQYCWPLMRERCGLDVWVKHENHTPTGAFKVRGGLVYLDFLKQTNALPTGFITATRGNHGQSIPFAASRHGVPVTVLVPEGNSVEKNRAMQAWGAQLIVHGVDFDEARVEAESLAQEQELAFAPSFHKALVTGVATYAFELFSSLPDLSRVYVPVGMGSGICAVITVRDLLGLKTEVIGVVSEHAPAYALSFEQGSVVETNDARTFADGLACRVPSADALAVIRQGAQRMVMVNDDEVAAAIRALYEDTHNVAVGAGAAALAALLQDQRSERLAPDSAVAVILTGGNIDAALFSTILRGDTPVV
ncbi:MAG: threonine dehydratase [Pseudomonadales bacterium]